jgi:hypothetical protein
MSDIYTGLISTGFTVLSYVAWKLVKRYVLKSQCVNGELHITVKQLHDKVTETNDFVNEFLSEMIRASQREAQKVPYQSMVTLPEEKKTDDN